MTMKLKLNEILMSLSRFGVLDGKFWKDNIIWPTLYSEYTIDLRGKIRFPCFFLGKKITFHAI